MTCNHLIVYISFHYPSTMTYRQLLPNKLNGSLKSPRATSGFIFHSFDCFQQGCHIGYHHLKHTEKEEQRVYQQRFELYMRLTDRLILGAMNSIFITSRGSRDHCYSQKLFNTLSSYCVRMIF